MTDVTDKSGAYTLNGEKPVYCAFNCANLATDYDNAGNSVCDNHRPAFRKATP